MSETKKRTKQGIFLTLIGDVGGIGSFILLITPLLSEKLRVSIGFEYKIASVIVGCFGLLFYLKYVMIDWVTEQVIESEKMADLKKDWKTEQDTLEKRTTYLEAWKEAANHFWNKKGVQRIIDPITLFMVTIMIILIILILKGKI